MEIVIRKALPEDLNAVNELDSSDEFEPRNLEKYLYPIDPSIFEENQIFLAESDGIIAGKIEFVSGSRKDLGGKIGAMRKFVVKKEFQNKGIGKKLLEFIIDYCKSKGFIALDLHVLESNKSARSLYEKMGFVERHKEVHYRKKL